MGGAQVIITHEEAKRKEIEDKGLLHALELAKKTVSGYLMMPDGQVRCCWLDVVSVDCGFHFMNVPMKPTSPRRSTRRW